jgi:hypothetical protein
MQCRKSRPPIVPLLLAGAIVMVLDAPRAAADAVIVDLARQIEQRSKAARLRTGAASDPDTVWIGHVIGSTGLPGTPGGYGPFHIGRGLNRPGGVGAANNGYFDFDRLNTAAGETDSLQGWVPATIPFASLGNSNFPDRLRPFFCFDYGNQGNYVGNQGHTSGKRTFGVTGYWHRDGGSMMPAAAADPSHNPLTPSWAPLAGSASAWCGLRSHGDIAAIDAAALGGTGNPITSAVLDYDGNNDGAQAGSLRPNGTDKNFPGYGSQWDQLLYRDVALTDGAALALSFRYRTNMSLGLLTLPAQRTGWFDKDPIKNVAVADGNFISSSDATATNSSPVDSFMVYIGIPVEPDSGSANDFVASDGAERDIYDVKRRWFSEVIRTGSGEPYRELLTRAGVHAAQTFSVSLPNSAVQPILDAQPGAGGKVRIVFRVKTNRSNDDQDNGTSAFTSNTAGAAIIDDVVVNGWAAANGDFEAAGAIDNRAAAVQVNVSMANGSTLLTSSRGDFTYVEVGYAVTGRGIPAGTTVTSKSNHFTLTISNPATLTTPTNIVYPLLFTGPAGVQASSVWKSTGKPPGVYFHLHSIEAGGGLPYDDPCGALTSPNRLCNLRGKVGTPGDHDAAEKPGGIFGSNSQDRQKFFASPAINLMSNADGDYNGMGIDKEIADVTGDYTVFFDVYINLLNFTETANGMRVAYQAYPSTQANGVKTWGEVTKTLTFFHFGGLKGCFQYIDAGMKGQQLLKTSNATGIPDSIRVFIEELSRCFTQPELSSNQCSPSSGANAGVYYDNISIALIDGASPPGLSAAVWDWWNDTFPTNGNEGFLQSPAFDTLAAQVRSAYNTSPKTGTPFTHNIPGDTMVVTANGANVRVDLIFRILPGVGNYTSIGNRASALRKRPDQGGGPTNTVAAGDGSFWGSYQGNAGVYGTGGNGVSGAPHDPDGPGPILPGTRWDPNHWNSARIDTAEINYFPANGVTSNLGKLTTGAWASMYHESDPRYTTLGIRKRRCFLILTAPNSPTDASNTTCGNAPYPPLSYATGGVPNGGTGLAASENGLPIGETYEFTKVIPDGQLTPGAHVEYFFRKSTIGDVAAFDMVPDTNQIFPSNEGWFDGHRWQQFGVLPDRWKDVAFGTGGSGMACMLVWDLGDRRGDELTWVSMADSIGLTTANRRGAHNGWTARGDQDITVGVDPTTTPPGIPAMAVRPHLGQAGSVWDLFQVHAGESNVPAGRLGSRGSSQQNPGLASGKFATAGPTGAMMRNYYRSLVLLAGDLGASSLGPIVDQSDDDVGLITDYLTNSTPQGSAPRALMAIGRDLVEGQNDPQAGHPTLFPTLFGVLFRHADYRLLAPNPIDVPDLIPVAPVNVTGGIYGVFSPCFFTNDVLNVNTAVTAANASAYYQNAGSNGPYIAEIYAAPTGGRIAHTVVEGFRIGSVGSRHTLTNGGLRNYYLQLLTNIFGAINCAPSGTPIGVGDGPDADASAFVSFMNLRSENPMRSGEARIAFGITRTEKVEVKIYDVTGRLVRTVADRIFPAHQEHVVTWDGTNDSGRPVARGVYFYQLRTPSFTSQKKVTVLRN